MFSSGVRGFRGLLLDVRVWLGLIVGAVALACGAGGAGAQSGRSGAATAHLYWTDRGAIVEADLNGAHPKTIAEHQPYPVGIAVDGKHLYWADGGPYVKRTNNTATGSIVEADLNGTHAKTIAKAQARPVGVAVGAGQLVWANSENSSVVESNLNGTNAKAIATHAHNAVGVAIAGGHVYWGLGGTYKQGDSTIVEADMNGTHPKTIVKSFFLIGLTIGDGHLYWGNQDGPIYEATLNRSHARKIVTGGYNRLGGFTGGLAVGGGHLYWALVNGSGTRSTIVEADLNGTHARTIARLRGGGLGQLAIGP